MTAIDTGSPMSPKAAIVIPLAGAIVMLITGLFFSTTSQQTRIKMQAEIIALQDDTIHSQRAIISHHELKFATGFLAGCGVPCIIRFNPGGSVNDYELLASYLNIRKQIVLIDGVCASACALFADRARAYIRITSSASFLFHRVSDGSEPPHSRDIAQWVNSHGGYPAFDSNDTTEMDFDAARRFWQPAFSDQRLPFSLDYQPAWPSVKLLQLPPTDVVTADLRGTIP